jgi:hypothetical protein
MLPSWYKEWIPRVSNIVSFVYPFKWENKWRYLEWVYKVIWEQIKYTGEYSTEKAQELSKEFPDFIWKYDIWKIIECEEVYLKEAQNVWTFVHQIMEDYIAWKWIWETKKGKWLYKKHKDVIHWWLEYIDQLKEKYIEEDWWKFVAEPVLLDKYNRFQWSSDLVLVNDKFKKVIIKDWKTFWIAKARWNLPNTYRKPYDKIKKWALQFSLYAEVYRQKWYDIEWIHLVYLHETGAYEYELDLYSTDDINNILEKYIRRDELLPPNIDLFFKYEPMKVEINTVIPEQAYSNARIIMEDQDLQNWKSMEENIEEAIRLQKYLISKY